MGKGSKQNLIIIMKIRKDLLYAQPVCPSSRSGSSRQQGEVGGRRKRRRKKMGDQVLLFFVRE